MVRLEGWERRLSDYLAETKNEDFIWGVNDCVLFAVKAVEVVTGENHYQQYLGYSDEQGAKQVIKDNGGLEELISKHFGQPHNKILRAKRADLVLVSIQGMRVIGIVDDSGERICISNEGGHSVVPLRFAKKVWSYG